MVLQQVFGQKILIALDIAPKIKAGVIWINSTNLLMLHVDLVVTKKVGLEERRIRRIRAYTKYELPS